MKRILGFLSLLTLMCPWAGGALGVPSYGAGLQPAVLSRVDSVKSQSTVRHTIITVSGNGTLPEYEEQTLPEPPRIVIDLLCRSDGFETRSVPLESPLLERLRIGRHPDRIRIVLDVKGPTIPAFSLTREKTSLRITVSHELPSMLAGDREPPPVLTEAGVEAPADPAGEQGLSKTLLMDSPGPGRDEAAEDKSRKSDMEALLDVSALDGQADALLLAEAVIAFQEKRWDKAIDACTLLLDKEPLGRYGERASFILAKAYERSRANAVSTHFMEIRGYYEAFLSRFPSSSYAGDALVALGHLCSAVGHHAEAMGYYGLAFSRDKASPAAAEALAGRMKIHMAKKQFDEALKVSRTIIEHYPQSERIVDIKLNTVQILYEMNRFQESLGALASLEREGARMAYLRPEISLYLGYNGYQLGNFPMTRENLFRFYNVKPGAGEIPAVLTKIGDAYRDERHFDAADKVYRWVVESYPDSEGALISQIRLAELQEQGKKTDREKGLPFGAQPGDKIPSPKEVYETMRQSGSLKDRKNPLTALALLKLAMLYQKEEDYGKSIAMIKELLERFPGEQLQKEAEHVLLKALQGAVTNSIQAQDDHAAVGFYYEEKDLFSKIESPELYVAIARVFLKLGLREDATELFRKAGPLLLDDEKPHDLLHFLALDLYRQKKPDQALEKVAASIEKGQGEEFLSEAYRLRGSIMADREQWVKAVEALDSALKHSHGDPCSDIEILTERAVAQAAGGMKGDSLASARKARALSSKCGIPSLAVHEKLGEVFSRLGLPDETLALLKEVTEREGMETGHERIRWKLAQAYERLGKKEESQSLYRDLARLGDPLWSVLANERIEESRFRQEMDSLKKR